jgi:ribosomal protein S18 acetylase RimI-like enzyme
MKKLIRPAKINDCDTVYNLCSMPGLVNPDGQPPRMFWIKSFVKEKKLFLVAEKNNEVVGFIAGEKTSGRVMLLWMLGVKKEWQGRGLGKKLLRAAEKQCRQKNIRCIVGYAYAKNKKILNLLDSQKHERGSLYYEYVKFL